MAASTLPTRSRSLFTAAMAVLAVTILFVSNSVQAQTIVVSDPPSMTEELAAIKAENLRLRGLTPSQSHSMMDVGYHFANLWFAGQESNWPLAQFYLGEVRSHIKWSIRLVPVRKSKNGEVKLADKFESFDGVKLAEIQKQIAAKDRKQFGVAYRDAMSGCNDCHTASDKPYLQVAVPHKVLAEGIDFTPQKGE
jgi:hypothetical protein